MPGSSDRLAGAAFDAERSLTPLDVLKMLEPETQEPIATPTPVIGLDVRGREAVSAPASAAAGDEQTETVAPPGRRRAKHDA